jgi:hypothetical protein
MPLRTPKGKKQAALSLNLEEVFRRHHSRPVGGLIAEIDPILRGWVNYFAFGHSSRCFSYVRFWVENKVRRHLARACQRRGFGWRRWSSEWFYGTLGLFNEYRVSCRWPRSKAALSRSAPEALMRSVQERVVRETRMLRAMRRGLKTELRKLLNGHEGGNPEHCQGVSYGPPRQFATLPGCDSWAHPCLLQVWALAWVA